MGELLDTVTFLVDKSILVRETSGAVVRFRMLETLREYGRDKAQDAGRYQELRRRHRAWCEQMVLDAETDWISPRQLEWIGRLEREQPNLREALEFCVTDSPEAGLRIVGSLFSFWISRGQFSEGRHFLDRLLAQQSRSPTADRAKAINAASVVAGLQGDVRAATDLVEEGHALRDRTTDPAVRAHLDNAEGYLAIFSRNLVVLCYLGVSARVFATFSRVCGHGSSRSRPCRGTVGYVCR